MPTSSVPKHLALLFTIGLFLLLAFPVCALAEIQWTFMSADTTGDIGKYCSMILDDVGIPHVSYRDVSNRQIWYLTGDAPPFAREPVLQDPGPPPYNGKNTSIGLGPDGSIGLAFGAPGNNKLNYRERIAGTWTLEWFDGDVGATQLSLAFDRDGQPHVVYPKPLVGLLDRHRLDDGWLPEVISPSGGWPSIKFAPDGTVGVAYQVSSRLAYAERDSAGWNAVFVDMASNSGWYTSLAIDSSGTPHIAHFQSGPHDLIYATRVSGQWQLETIDTAGPTGYYPSIATDSEGKPWIAYTQFVATDTTVIKLAVKEGGSWSISSVDTVNGIESVGLGLDAMRRAHVTYYDGRTGDLMYAVSDAPTSVARASESVRPHLELWPNPAVGGRVWMALAESANTRREVHVYDVAGRRVRNLTIPIAAEPIQWDGRDDAGRSVAAGTYFFRIAGTTEARRLTLIR